MTSIGRRNPCTGPRNAGLGRHYASPLRLETAVRSRNLPLHLVRPPCPTTLENVTTAPKSPGSPLLAGGPSRAGHWASLKRRSTSDCVTSSTDVEQDRTAGELKRSSSTPPPFPTVPPPAPKVPATVCHCRQSVRHHQCSEARATILARMWIMTIIPLTVLELSPPGNRFVWFEGWARYGISGSPRERGKDRAARLGPPPQPQGRVTACPSSGTAQSQARPRRAAGPARKPYGSERSAIPSAQSRKSARGAMRTPTRQ